MPGNEIQLKDFQGECNVLFPQTTMQQISPFHRIRVEKVQVNPDPKAGDVYPVGGGGLALSKTALMKIANAAGIVWNWRDTGPLSADKDYVLYQAVGAMRKPSGELIPLKATKEIDLEVIREETYQQKLKAAQNENYKNPEQYAEDATKTAMIQWRKNKLMRAETGAMLRVVRGLLSIKGSYTQAELQKPFAVPTVDFAPDYSDPMVRRMITEQGLRASSELFGNHSGGGEATFPEPVDVDHLQLASGQEKADEGEVNDRQLDDERDLPFGDEPPFEEDEPNLTDEDLATIDAQANDRTPPPPPEDPPQTGQPTCTECGTLKVTQKVIDFSRKKYGRILCFKCQQEVGDQS